MTKKYKYHVHRFNVDAYESEVLKDLEETELMMRGNEGWELVSVTIQKEKNYENKELTWKYYYFKKEK